ncbi:MAG: NAD(P)/FAD-dependent oxidoreductase [Nevskia sp.]|nr:NAD(P)/FAD-dependent oxidoreductase [Nevskia sp.]
MNASRKPNVAIIGTGFGGLGMAYYLKQAGIESFTMFEKAADVGGVWRENTYPGAACDIPSHLYSFSFEPHYPWSCRYGKQSEILEYLRHVARKYDLRSHIRFGQEVVSADFDESRGVWVLNLRDGGRFEADLLIPAVGQLHQPQIPQIENIEQFRGRAFHSARWQHDYDFKGKTAAVIGTGPSAVQLVPELAKQVQKLYVFQRSPGWCVPKYDRPYSKIERALLTHVPQLHSMDRGRIFWSIEYLASALQPKSRINALSKAIFKYGSRLLMRQQVKDPALRRKLTPDYPIGCKRTLLSNEWLKTLAAPNVEVVTQAIAGATATGLRTDDGKLREVDAIVYGTGFEATKFLAPMRVTGLDGQTLNQRWQNGAEAYLGMGVSGFPNLFIVYGPNTNLGAGSIIFMVECQQKYIAQAAALLRDEALSTIDVLPQAEREFIDQLRSASKDSVYEAGCHSWYLSADGRNINNWIGYMSDYRRAVRALDRRHYRMVPNVAEATGARLRAA